MADGALKTDVLKVLEDAGVSVEAMEEPEYFRISKGNITYVVRLMAVISRTVTGRMSRNFDIPKTRFFPATLKIVPPQATEAKPPVAKAAGQQA